jgi:hypothetical protein
MIQQKMPMYAAMKSYSTTMASKWIKALLIITTTLESKTVVYVPSKRTAVETKGDKA